MIKIRALQTDGFYRKLPLQSNIEEDVVGTVKMFRAVLDYALVDAIKTTSERSYFNTSSEGLEDVCYNAIIDCNWVRQAAKMFFKKWDQENSKGEPNVNVSVFGNYDSSSISVF